MCLHLPRQGLVLRHRWCQRTSSSQGGTIAGSVRAGQPRRSLLPRRANSGIGLNAASKLAMQGHKVFLACRTLAKAEAAAAQIKAAQPSADVVPMECDLASMASIRAFSDRWHSLGERLDVLVLNAGVQFSGAWRELNVRCHPLLASFSLTYTSSRPSGERDVLRTSDGFEITVGTNHLGHFLLANLLLPDLNAAGEGARIVVTASEVHDPASAGGSVGLGAHLGDLSGLAQGPAFTMVDGGAYDADKAYKDSKLCNMLFTRELSRRLEAAGSKVGHNRDPRRASLLMMILLGGWAGDRKCLWARFDHQDWLLPQH